MDQQRDRPPFPAGTVADPGAIWRANLDCSNPHVLIGGQDAPYGVAIGP
jgi:hypothetical protein